MGEAFQVSRAGKVTCLLPGTSRRLDVPGESLVTGCFFAVAQKHLRPRLVLLVTTRNDSGFQVSRAGKVTCLLPGTSRRLDVPGERLELS